MIRLDVKTAVIQCQSLLFSGPEQSRQDKSWGAILRIARDYSRGAPVPPILVTAGPDGWVVKDGFHRVCGAALAGAVSLPAVVV